MGCIRLQRLTSAGKKPVLRLTPAAAVKQIIIEKGWWLILVKGNRVNTFLVEIIVVILFFSLSAAVTLQVFAATHLKGQQSTDLNMAVILTQRLTEEYRANGVSNEWCHTPETQGGQTVYTVWYDKDWNPVEENGRYKLLFTVSELSSDEAGREYGFTAEVFSVGEEQERSVYRLESEQYSANR